MWSVPRIFAWPPCSVAERKLLSRETSMAQTHGCARDDDEVPVLWFGACLSERER